MKLSEILRQKLKQYGPLSVLPEYPTEAQRTRAGHSALYSRGDMVLVWVNEGDLCQLNHSNPATPLAVDREGSDGGAKYAALQEKPE